MMNIDTLKREYKSFLMAEGYAPSTIQTSYTDAFYFFYHNAGMDFSTFLQRNVDIEEYKDTLLAVLKKNSKGDVNKNINGYLYHLKKLRQFVLLKEYGTLEITDDEPQHKIITIKNKPKNTKLNIPYPNNEEVKKYLLLWDKLENYRLQEDALNKLFLAMCPYNSDISDVLLKAATLNDFYSTNIYSVFPVAKHIVDMNIDKRLNSGDITLVDEIQKVTISGKEKHFYSFATKYCS
ncbi:MAG: hypothetical protein RR415_14475, partial [Ruthenibacterium sp.]